MSTIIRLDMDPVEKILAKRGMEQDGRAHLLLANELRRRSDKYVPFLTGMLKNSARTLPGKIIYIQPYARRQWYEHRGKGLRGPQWCIRCWNAEGKEISASLARYIGGKT